jgi:hypothetical protein
LGAGLGLGLAVGPSELVVDIVCRAGHEAGGVIFQEQATRDVEYAATATVRGDEWQGVRLSRKGVLRRFQFKVDGPWVLLQVCHKNPPLGHWLSTTLLRHDNTKFPQWLLP